eukprot:scaffold326929_cov67-Tisochrysis_lutea.AAC.1
MEAASGTCRRTLRSKDSKCRMCSTASTRMGAHRCKRRSHTPRTAPRMRQDSAPSNFRFGCRIGKCPCTDHSDFDDWPIPSTRRSIWSSYLGHPRFAQLGTERRPRFHPS